MAYDPDNQAPFFAPDGPTRLALIIIVAIIGGWLWGQIHPRTEPELWPFEAREAAAKCILTEAERACAIYEAFKEQQDRGRN